METSLHRALKLNYADQPSQTEVRLGRFRIDALHGDELIEIQHGSLAAIRAKIQKLVRKYRVRVVKPIVARKQLIKLNRQGGKVLGRRWSPKRGRVLDVFHELVYFTSTFPHPNLTLELPLVDIEEIRYPGHGRRRWWRENDHLVADQKLLVIHQCHRLQDARDLGDLVPGELPAVFHTGHLAGVCQVDRWYAQRIAYCLREMGAVRQVGKSGNTRLYEFVHERTSNGK